MRGIFFDEESARGAERKLVADGYQVELTRVRFAGEDDDEGHPWAITTDAPEIVLELLVDRYDGWLDDEVVETPRPVLAPEPLPDAPRRRHRPD
ncbi:MAG: hypothetical protein JWP74_2218 [Marmoricola sp.]|nr:hypothetical protein [Marmoricola sp.]